jgi:uncharacterized protein (DUF1697 family)
MAVIISMLRGVNVGAHNRIKMDALRALYEPLELRDPQTYVQSGNVVFRTDKRDLAALAKRIEDKNRAGLRLSSHGSSADLWRTARGDCQKSVRQAERHRAEQTFGVLSRQRSRRRNPRQSS